MSKSQLLGSITIYALIHLSSEHRIHVFGTHLQANDGEEEVEVRKCQIQKIGLFVEAANIPQNEFVFITGDLNTSPGLPDFPQLYDTGFVSFPVVPCDPTYWGAWTCGGPYTWDFTTNSYGDELDNNQTLRQYDHVLYSRFHQTPRKGVQKITSVIGTYRNDTVEDLSDHHGITGIFSLGRHLP